MQYLRLTNCTKNSKITLKERRFAARMAEYPGDPDTFPFEELSDPAKEMVRNRLKEQQR